MENAYKKVAQAIYPIFLPYDRLLTTARVYLQQLGTSRAELIRHFSDAQALLRDRALVAESLGLVRRDFEILTFTTLSGEPLDAPIKVEELFGFGGDAVDPDWTGSLAKSRRLLEALQITFEELVTLLRTHFVGGEVPTGKQTELSSRLLLTVDQLRDLRGADFVVEPDSEIDKALALGGLTADDVKGYVEERLDGLSTTIVLDPPIGCDPDEITLKHLDASLISNSAEWLAIHRFVRLAKRMKVSFADLDAALHAVSGGVRPDFTAPMLAKLADLRDVKDSLELSWPVAASLVADIGTHGAASLYNQLFLRDGLARVHADFRSGPNGEVLVADLEIGTGIPGMAAAFGVPEDMLLDLSRELGVTRLNLAGVSAIHRTIVLSRSLGIEATQVIRLRKAWTDESLLKFMARVRGLKAAGFSPNVVAFLKGAQTPKQSGVGNSLGAIEKILEDLQLLLKPLREQEVRERAEEQERAEAGTPFTDKEVATRKAEGERRSQSAALSFLAEAFRVSLPVMSRLLADATADGQSLKALLRFGDLPAIALFSSEIDTEVQQTAAMRLLVGIDRIAVLIGVTGLDPDAFNLVAGEAGILSASVIGNLLDDPAGDALAEALGDVSVFKSLVKGTGRPAAMAVAIKALAKDGWSDTTCAAVVEWLDHALDAVKDVPRDNLPELGEESSKKRPVAALSAMRERLSLLRRIGAAASDVKKLTHEPVGKDTLDRLEKGVSSNYDRKSWLDVSRQLSDPIREESRNALVSFLLQQKRLRYAEQLFDLYLIDVGTNSFVLTSRIRQAIFAVQTFVQRCLMGLERARGVSPGQIDLEEWKVISRQAVWSARGKALLYPEELLNPSRRDNKSNAFKSFESALQQGDITSANAEIAYRAYLDELHIVASLEVCGTYLQEVFEGREATYFKSVLHVVGRTRGGAVRKYFYRRLNRYDHHEEWSSWEPVDVDIQAIEQDRQEARSTPYEPLVEAGVHLLPVVWQGQVHLFWPTFVRKIDQSATPPQIDSANPIISARFSLPYWEIKLCWTRKDGANWAPKQQSSALFETWWFHEDEVPPDPKDVGSIDYGASIYDHPKPRYPEPRSIVLKAHRTDDALSIVVGTRNGAWTPAPRGSFSFARAASEMQFSTSAGNTGGDHLRVKANGGATPYFMGFRASGAVSFVASQNKPEGDVLFTAPRGVRVTTLNQSYGAPLNAPFFIDLEERAYFAQSSIGATTVNEDVTEPEFIKPLMYQELTTQNEFHSMLVSKAKVEKNPWLAASAAQATPLVASLVESGAGDTNKYTTSAEKLADKKYFQQIGTSYRTIEVPALNIEVKPFFHPFADFFSEVLRRDGFNALLTPEMQRLKLATTDTFKDRCNPNANRVTAPTEEGLDFEQSSPYGNYNWELFFHAPVMMAHKLWENSQPEAAIDVIRQAVYTPFATSEDPEDCWRFEGLRDVKPIRLDAMLALLSRPNTDPEKQNVLAQIDIMRLHPFQAHRIARLRPLAYKKWVVAFHVRLQVAIGDRYFSRFTPEDVNQAIPYYMVAYLEMGKMPEKVTQRATMPARSYAELRPDLDAMGNVMFEAETKLSAVGSSAASGADSSATGVMQRGAIGYFGIPKNEKLLAVWDLVADRLFKIRNGMNIDGVQMQLPLFSPPIDPALLAEAVAAGLDIGAVLDQLAQPLPQHRYDVMYRRAVEQAEAVVRLGDMLFSAREKRDNEDLVRKRAMHEKEMADLLAESRQRQLEEAEAQRDAVIHEEDGGVQRWMHFADLLGERPEASLFFVPFQARPARKLKLVDADKIAFEMLSVIPDIAKIGSFALAAVDEAAGGVKLSSGTVLEEEKQELESSFEAVKTTFDAAMLDTLAALLGVIPNFEAAVKPFGAGAAVHLGGSFFSAAASSKARNKRAAADMHNFVASVYRKQADLILRERNWVLEMNSAALDVLQARRKRAVADIQVDLAKKAVASQKKEVEHAQAIETFLKEKFTNVELHEWYEKRLRQFFKQCCECALETARMAESCYVFERERPATPFIRTSMPKDAREELVVGHELLARLRDMDRAYLAAPRAPELTRLISLRQIDPFALYQLRETGEAEFEIPEVLFDIDHPGHYDRRIKSVQVTIPCVAGPYAPVTGSLTLTSSRRRKKPQLDIAPVLDPATGASIELSSCRNDAGLFEFSTRDPLYLPFEGMGTDSTWKLRLPKTVRNHNYWLVSDVGLTFQYFVKKGSQQFREKVENKLAETLNALRINTSENGGPYQLVSMCHELPDAWHRFRSGQGLSISLSTDLLSYMLQGMQPKLMEVAGKIKLKGAEASEPLTFKTPSGDGSRWSLELDGAPNGALGDPEKVEDITLFARYQLT